MGGNLAILAGDGVLPVQLAQAHPDAVRIVFDGVAHKMPDPVLSHRFETLGGLFDDLKARGVTRVVFAGSMARPPLNPAGFDDVMTALAPRLLAAMQGGDDALLRLVIEIFEEQRFQVLGAHELLPELTAKKGLLSGSDPEETVLADANRAADILAALSPLDVGQGAVVAGGLCLGIETLQGTQALLDFVAATPAHLRRGAGGVFVKAPKRGQDLRVDMPAIGPDTASQIARAGLQGAVIEAGRVLILEREKTLAAFATKDLFLLAREF